MANKKRLIDANEAKKKLRAVQSWFVGYPSSEQDKLARAVVKMCIEEIGKIKPVDAVEVVRCEECIHCYQLVVDENGYWLEVTKGGTDNLCRRNEETFSVRCDDFCSYGEKKAE